MTKKEFSDKFHYYLTSLRIFGFSENSFKQKVEQYLEYNKAILLDIEFIEKEEWRAHYQVKYIYNSETIFDILNL